MKTNKLLMNKLEEGEFYGEHYSKLVFKDILVTDTEYVHSKVDWHYHENPYFTYLLQGKLFEYNKKESYCLEPGSLLFHNWQDAHYNLRPDEYTRGFHLELNQDWFKNFDIPQAETEGSMDLKNPIVKNLMNLIYLESKINDQFSSISIECNLVKIFDTFQRRATSRLKSKPSWVRHLKEILHEERIDYNLSTLSQTLDIHPIHLSRAFKKYFGTNFGHYMRILKVNKAVQLMYRNKYSLTEICYECGFYDQSHFISTFKSTYGITPSKFLNQIRKS